MIDKLDVILYKQSQLGESLGFITAEKLSQMSKEDKLLWINKLTAASIAESVEVLEGTGFSKWWKSKPVDIDHVKEEVIDEFFFILDKFRVLGMSSVEVFEKYDKKWEKNMSRTDWDGRKTTNADTE